MKKDYMGRELIEGPCSVCGGKNYQLSMGGPSICPTCDCGQSIDPKEYRRLLCKYNDILSHLVSLGPVLVKCRELISIVDSKEARAILPFLDREIRDLVPPTVNQPSAA